MPSSEHVIVIGGTGFSDYHVVNELLVKGWCVDTFGLPIASPATFSPTVRVVFRAQKSSDAGLLASLRGHDCLVFAARLDDRVTPLKPVYPTFYRAKVDVCVHLLRLAAQAGIQRAIVLGSCFTHFNRVWTKLSLAAWHPYIRSFAEQEVDPRYLHHCKQPNPSSILDRPRSIGIP